MPPKLHFTIYILAASLSCCTEKPHRSNATVMTVSGIISSNELRKTLIHEHVFLDWSGADSLHPENWNNEEAIVKILPHLKALSAYGVNSFFECTPAYLGRNPLLLKQLADSTGLNIITNTGYYGAVHDKYLPPHAFTETADQLAARWVDEFENGIDSTGIRPGFIKISVDADSVVSPVDEKLVRAAARTHLKTGLTIVSHTGPDMPAIRQVQLLTEEGVSPSAWVWTHAQNGTSATHIQLAKQGAWISLDGLGWAAPQDGDSTTVFQYITNLKNLKHAGLLHRTLISQDAGWYTHGEAEGGDYQPHTLLFTVFIPLLLKNGFTQSDIDTLLIINPKDAYSLQTKATR